MNPKKCLQNYSANWHHTSDAYELLSLVYYQIVKNEGFLECSFSAIVEGKGRFNICRIFFVIHLKQFYLITDFYQVAMLSSSSLDQTDRQTNLSIYV